MENLLNYFCPLLIDSKQPLLKVTMKNFPISIKTEGIFAQICIFVEIQENRIYATFSISCGDVKTLVQSCSNVLSLAMY